MAQEQVWLITLVLMVLIVAPFIYVMKQSRAVEEYAVVQARAGKVRGILFWGLLLVFTPVMLYTLGNMPYSALAGGVEPVKIKATGYQWYWEIDRNTVPVGAPVEFHVTSADVNHGFGIYDADMRIVTQTQAMPEYTNVLKHTFEKPGVYKVLCMEYCGLAHHGMTAEITVTSAQAAAEGEAL